VVPVTQKEYNRIKKAMKKMSISEIIRLKKQVREPMTCPLVDTENQRCSVYEYRPEICKMFGHYEKLICYYHPEYAIGSDYESKKYLHSKLRGEKPIGILGFDITWGKGL
jgi:uncharacterized protein